MDDEDATMQRIIGNLKKAKRASTQAPVEEN